MTKEIPVSVGAKLLGVNRTSIYYKGTPVSEEELAYRFTEGKFGYPTMIELFSRKPESMSIKRI